MTENGPPVVADTNSSVDQLVVPPWVGTLVGAATGAFYFHSAGHPLDIWGIPAILGFALLGLFFSLCANRTTILGYLLVGLFMGINCGILTLLIRLTHLDANWPLAIDHHTSWRHCFGFGGILAVTAILFSVIQGSPAQQTVPKD